MLSEKGPQVSLMYMALCVCQLIKLEARGGTLEWDCNCVCVTVGQVYSVCNVRGSLIIGLKEPTTTQNNM
jgi:hypothetical protein